MDNPSQTQTTTAQADSRPQQPGPAPGQATGQHGQKVGAEKLPEPNRKLDEAERITLEMEDVYSIQNAGPDANGEGEGKAGMVFDKAYQNVDDVVDDFRNKLAAVISLPFEDNDHEPGVREEYYQKLMNAAFPHRPKADFQSVKNDVFAWAQAGYTGQPETNYYDAEGKPRIRQTQEDPQYSKLAADDTAAKGGGEEGEDVNMAEATSAPKLPSDMTPYQKIWAGSSALLKSLFQRPTLWNNSQHKLRVALERANEEIRNLQKKDNSLLGGIDLQIPVQTMLYTEIFCAQTWCDGERAKSAGDTVQAGKEEKKIHDMSDLLREQLKRAQQPEVEWMKLLADQIQLKGLALQAKYGQDTESDPLLWGRTFLQSLQDGANTKVPKSEAADPTGKKNSGHAANAEDEKSIPAFHSQQPDNQTSGTRPSAQFQPSTRKGFAKMKFKKDYVIYAGCERKVGAIRAAGSHVWGGGNGWQVLVQMNRSDAEFPFWHIVASSNFDKGMIRRYQEDNPDAQVIDSYETELIPAPTDRNPKRKRKVHTNRGMGTADDIEGNLEDFNFGGFATMPRKPSGLIGTSNPMQLVWGYFDEREDPKFWSRSTLGKVFRQKAVDEWLGQWLQRLGFDDYSPKKAPVKHRDQPPQRARKTRVVEEDEDEEEYDRGDDVFEQSDGEYDQADGRYHNEPGESFIAEDDFDAPVVDETPPMKKPGARGAPSTAKTQRSRKPGPDEAAKEGRSFRMRV